MEFQDKVLGSTDIKDWLDDAQDYSSEGTSHVFVEISSWSEDNHLIHSTDFQVTPEQARAMFFGIAGAQK